MFSTCFSRSIARIIILFLLIAFNQSNSETIRNINTEKFQYISPHPSSKLNSPYTNIIIRFGSAFAEELIFNSIPLKVTGSKSGEHTGKIILAENNRTLIFNPYEKFNDGELVTVELNENLKTISDEVIPYLSFSFETSKINLNKIVESDKSKTYLKKRYPELFELNQNQSNKSPDFETYLSKKSIKEIDSLPDDFPEFFIDTVDNPTPGSVFLTPFVWHPASPNEVFPTYLIITDNYGTPVFHRKMKAPTFDFKKQKTGVLTYYYLGTNYFYVMDNSYNIIDSLAMQNGYLTDIHECEILENGNTLLMSYDFQKIEMNLVVPEGRSDATVIGLIIQELDESKNVVFQWRSWDHYLITDATFNYDLRDSLIDYVHGNAIEMDYDGNLLISSRHMDEITKINRQTGEIIWRFGGEHCKNNQFTFINDTIGFSHQHDIRQLPNGNIMLFDNGNLHNPAFTRIVEYQLDEENKLAFLVWEYRNAPETFSAFMGSARRLDNHNTFIGWGSHTSPAISEITPNGKIALHISLPDSLLNYRAFKSSWKANLFVTSPDNLNFGYVPVGDSTVKSLTIFNNSNEDIKINGLFNRYSAFRTSSPLPIIIPSFEQEIIDVTFKPERKGDFSDNLHLRMNKKNERIAQVVSLAGSTDSTVTSIGSKSDKLSYSLSQNYPNPFNPSSKIKFSIPKTSFVNLTVYDVLGRVVTTLINKEMKQGNHEIEFSVSEKNGLSSGIYIYTLQADEYKISRKMMLMK